MPSTPIPMGRRYMNEQSGENKVKEKINKSRLAFAILYFLLGCLIIRLFRRDMFYLSPKEDSWNVHRFLWCIACTFWGFAAVAFQLRCHNTSPFPEYIFYYPLQLVAMACLVFSVLHLWDRTEGYVFYYLSFSLCFSLGFLVDSYWSFIKGLLTKLKIC